MGMLLMWYGKSPSHVRLVLLSKTIGTVFFCIEDIHDGGLIRNIYIYTWMIHCMRFFFKQDGISKTGHYMAIPPCIHCCVSVYIYICIYMCVLRRSTSFRKITRWLEFEKLVMAWIGVEKQAISCFHMFPNVKNSAINHFDPHHFVEYDDTSLHDLSNCPTNCVDIWESKFKPHGTTDFRKMFMC